MNQEHDVVVVGAGPGGIASALALKDAGLSAVVLDQAEEVGSSWRGRYDSLHLNTWRRFSQLPGRPYPKGTPTFPSRDQVIEYLERHAGEEGMDLRLGTRVERIERDERGWVVRTSAGELRARQLIVATGLDRGPVVPDWPGREDFKGELIHSSQYRNPRPFEGKRVVVVGPGSSGMEIAHELAEGGAGKVWLAVRTPPNVLLRQGPGPVPGDLIATWLWHLPTGLADRIARFAARMDLGDLTEYGLGRPETGVFADVRKRGKVPAIVDGEVIEAIKEGRIEVVTAVTSLGSTWVELADGVRIEPEAVICATGYRRGLEPLVGHLDVLGERGMPKALAPRPAAPGLRFVGYLARPGGLGYMGKQARRSAKAIASELRRDRSRKEDDHGDLDPQRGSGAPEVV
ncbi:MAG TPA: NAD(P)/FAD-dependent oxidoreductase [Solirubrobacterales bacterium]|nr:NAD(P)/FAD-dependent oxidoreductase [Solirubrobacterales bacterium]